jgi:hypothetical protein
MKIKYFHANWLPKEVRYLGYYVEYYDGERYCLGFWFFHVYYILSEPTLNIPVSRTSWQRMWVYIPFHL